MMDPNKQLRAEYLFSLYALIDHLHDVERYFLSGSSCIEPKTIFWDALKVSTKRYQENYQWGIPSLSIEKERD